MFKIILSAFCSFVALTTVAQVKGVASIPGGVKPRTVASPALAKDSIVEIKGVVLGPICPLKRINGNRDFEGHGPEIWASVKLSYSPSAVVAVTNFRAKETGGDGTEMKESKIEILYKAPPGFSITALQSGKSAEVNYISRPGFTRFEPGFLAERLNADRVETVIDKNDGLLSYWDITGDTGGDDVADNNNCPDATKMSVGFKPIRIKLTRNVSDIIDIKLESIGELTPKQLTRGDREFDGHGPRVKCEVKLKIAPDGTALLADITFSAEETVSDWSTVTGSWTREVYRAPYGKRIQAIVSEKASRTQFISPPGGFQFIAPGEDVSKALYTFLDYTDIKSAVLKAFGYGPNEKSALSALVKGTIDRGNTVVQVPSVDGTLVKFFHMVGDTGGPDISSDDNGNDDTRIVKIEFFPAKIRLVDDK